MVGEEVFWTKAFKVASPMPAVAPTKRAVGVGKVEILYVDAVSALPL